MLYFLPVNLVKDNNAFFMQNWLKNLHKYVHVFYWLFFCDKIIAANTKTAPKNIRNVKISPKRSHAKKAPKTDSSDIIKEAGPGGTYF